MKELTLEYHPGDGIQETLDNRRFTITDEVILKDSTADMGIRVTTDWEEPLDIEIWSNHIKDTSVLNVYPLDGTNDPISVEVRGYDFAPSTLFGAVATAIDFRIRQTVLK